MLGAGVLHLTVLQSHLQEALGLGLFFCAIGVAQVAWSVLYAVSPTRRTARIGFALLAIGPLALWTLTRILRSPWSDGPEGMDLVSLATVALQVAAAILLVPALAGAAAPATSSRRATVVTTSVMLAIGLLAGGAAYGSALVAEANISSLGEGQDHHGAVPETTPNDHDAGTPHASTAEKHPG